MATEAKESELSVRAAAAQKELSIAKRTAKALEPLGPEAAKRVIVELARWFDLELAEQA